MARAYDPRLTPVRPDLAASQLRGVVDAPRFADGKTMQVVEASAPLKRSPAPDAPLETEALFGEAVTVYDEAEGWAWAQLDRDLYVGYLPLAALGAPTEPTHRVSALRTHAYPGPNIKLPPRMALSLGARLRIVRKEADFAVSADGLWLWRRHLADVGSGEPDFVAVAELFLELPISGAGARPRGSTVQALRRPRSPPPESPPRATAICWPPWASRLRSTARRRSRAATSSSGKAMWGSCATARPCCTPTAST